MSKALLRAPTDADVAIAQQMLADGGRRGADEKGPLELAVPLPEHFLTGFYARQHARNNEQQV